MKTYCTACDRRLKVPDHLIGKRVQCRCGNVMRLQDRSPAAPAGNLESPAVRTSAQRTRGQLQLPPDMRAPDFPAPDLPPPGMPLPHAPPANGNPSYGRGEDFWSASRSTIPAPTPGPSRRHVYRDQQARKRARQQLQGDGNVYSALTAFTSTLLLILLIGSALAMLCGMIVVVAFPADWATGGAVSVMFGGLVFLKAIARGYMFGDFHYLELRGMPFGRYLCFGILALSTIAIGIGLICFLFFPEPQNVYGALIGFAGSIFFTMALLRGFISGMFSGR